MKKPLCVVAGVGPGVGLAVARAFAGEGFDLVLMARRADALEQYRDALAPTGAAVQCVPADLSDPASVAAAHAAVAAGGRVPELVVYNAGRWQARPALDWPVEEFQRELMLCVGAAHQLVTLFAPAMAARGRGALLFTGGGLALYPQFGKGVAALTAGKSALRGYAFALAEELRPLGLHVGTVTVAGQVAEGTPFAPDRIAESFLRHWRRGPAGPVEEVHHG